MSKPVESRSMNKNQIPQSESMIPHIDSEQYVIDPEIPELIDVDLAKNIF